MKRMPNIRIGNTVYSFTGQISFLLTNFLLFIYLAKNYDQTTFGHWAIFITTISILDGMRQGFTQNGLARLIIKHPGDREIRSTSLLLNYAIVIITSIILKVLAVLSDESIGILYSNGYKILIVLATIQYLNTVYQANYQFRQYFIINLIYLISFVSAMAFQILVIGKPELTTIINLMLISIVPNIALAIYRKQFYILKPRKETALALIHFGKYSSGTNLMSLLFQRVDLIMINYFLDPTSVAIFHFATKIINYAELPLQALSQVIYPKIATSHLSNNGTELNKTYGASILWILAFIIPMSLTVIIFNKTIITLIGSVSYLPASSIILVLCIATFFKPWGRVFGLTLDAVGKPKVNFYMLAFSLIVNVIMNWVLIPVYGINGAAIATSLSIIITIIIGQFNIRRTLKFNPVHEVLEAFKTMYHLKISKKWN